MNNSSAIMKGSGNNNTALILSIVAFVALIIICLCCMCLSLILIVGEETTIESRDNIEETKLEEPVESNESEQTNSASPIQVNDLIWTVLSAENLGNSISSNNEFIPELTKEEGIFVKVTFTVENTSDNIAFPSQPDMFAADSGQEYQSITNQYSYVESDESYLIFESLDPKEAKEFVTIFSTPNIESFRLRVEGNNFIDKEDAFIEVSLD